MQTTTSCIDHVYCNTEYRISAVKIITCGSSDHDAILYTRFSKDPVPPARTIRKRSYKTFNEKDYVKDVSNLDFTEVYSCVDVDEAASLLTEKLVTVLNQHAPWIIFQQRKNFAPWITPETLELMKQRDKFKEEAKAMANCEGREASPEQAELWSQHKKLRNQIYNRIKQEEITIQEKQS